ncbi:hypothetical protein [Streptomyces sp. RPT161]|uniref:hypothetical protein n=1 Tax=Streptomyces sp. RPT161 TaxID=3015993 RepID=UPI0022B8EA83|nr:hypothetical protein [Streptomyces sp. RPT161]
MPSRRAAGRLCCHLNTPPIQQVLAESKWADRLTDADRLGLAPPFWTHVNPYGRLDWERRG